MKKVTIKFALLAVAAILAVPQGVFAQDYEDDLYYSPSKAAKERKEKEAALAKLREQQRIAREYKPADTYTVTADKPLSVDVDAYNRRTVDTVRTVRKAADDTEFSYTRRIERYHNPEVVSSSNDEELKQYYYSTPTEADVNVYVINNIDPYMWNSFWPTYSWNNPYYWNSWYRSYWYPGFSFSFGFDPWFSFGWNSPWYGPAWGYPWGPGWGPAWGWGPSWGWGPGWHPGHGPGHGPGWNPGRPGGGGWAVNPPGASTPRRPTYQGSSSHTNSFDQSRPGAMGQSRPNNNSGYRPSQNGGTNYPAGGYAPSNNSRRGSGSSRYGSSSTTRGSSNSGSYNNSSPRRSSSSGYNNSGSYNSGSNRGSYNSGSSYGSGRGSSYGSGRGSSGGGGASHGRRR